MGFTSQEIIAHRHIDAAANYKKNGQFLRAEAEYKLALSVCPASLVALYNLANLLKVQGRLNDAKAYYLEALTVDPESFQVHFNLANLLRSMSEFQAASKHYLQTVRIRPDFADAYSSLGLTYGQMHRLDEAEVCHKKAIQLAPDSPKVLSNYADILIQRDRYAEASEVLERALSIDPKLPQCVYSIAMLALAKGSNETAINALQRCIELNWETASVTNTLAFTIAASARATEIEYLDIAKSFESHALNDRQRSQAKSKEFVRASRLGRKLRIGYLSGDYRNHAVSNFSEPVFLQHDREKFDLILYTTCPFEDAITERFKMLADDWVSLVGLSDEQANERICTDEIDILIDLMGHTTWNRLGVLAMRAAPIQAHYLGYFASTGVSQIDYWLADEILAPQVSESQFSERLWRLPRPWMAYNPKLEAPVPRWESKKTVWLGSFNNLSKLTKETLDLWSSVLKALPEASLLLKTTALQFSESQTRIWKHFERAGIDRERILLKGETESWSDHMSLYDQLDIALDPIGGWCGATTTCDALWMGVPVVTLAGKLVGQRMTASLVNGLGHPEWVASDQNDYIEKVVTLARNVEHRKMLRNTQRQRMAESSICDAKGLAQALETAYESMFDIWWEKNKAKYWIG